MRRLVVGLLAATVVSGPVLLTSGCGTGCKGTVQRQQLLDPNTIKLTVYKGSGSSPAHCYPVGTVAQLAACYAGTKYPACAK